MLFLSFLCAVQLCSYSVRQFGLILFVRPVPLVLVAIYFETFRVFMYGSMLVGVNHNAAISLFFSAVARPFIVLVVAGPVILFCKFFPAYRASIILSRSHYFPHLFELF